MGVAGSLPLIHTWWMRLRDFCDLPDGSRTYVVFTCLSLFEEPALPTLGPSILGSADFTHKSRMSRETSPGQSEGQDVCSLENNGSEWDLISGHWKREVFMLCWGCQENERQAWGCWQPSCHMVRMNVSIASLVGLIQPWLIPDPCRN